MKRFIFAARYVLLPVLAWASMLEAASPAAPSSQEVNFRVPRREYVAVAGEWNIYVERTLVAGDSDLASAAQEKLVRSLREIFAALPEHAARELRTVTFYLMWGGEGTERR